MDRHDKELMLCAKTRISKGEQVTFNKLHERCRVDFRTVRNHFDHIFDKDLGDGTKITRGTVQHPGFVKDPPGDTNLIIQVDPPADIPPENGLVSFALGALFGGLVVTIAAILMHAYQRGEHVCSWAPLEGADSWVRVCEICGRHGCSLNDPTSPIYFGPVSN